MSIDEVVSFMLAKINEKKEVMPSLKKER